MLSQASTGFLDLALLYGQPENEKLANYSVRSLIFQNWGGIRQQFSDALV
ncbi:MAG: hypothetical protein ACYTXC_27855 [Nostoc sp.]